MNEDVLLFLITIIVGGFIAYATANMMTITKRPVFIILWLVATLACFGYLIFWAVQGLRASGLAG